MTGQRGWLSNIGPVLTSSAQPNAPMGAAFDANMAFQAEGMAYRFQTTGMSFHWPVPNFSPKVSTATVNSDVIMQTGGVDSELCWLAHPNAQRLVARVYVAVGSFDLDLQLSLETKTLISAVTTTQGPIRTFPPRMDMPALGGWGQRAGALDRWKLSYGIIDVLPEYPADRTLPFAVRFKAQWSSDQDPTNLSITRAARLVTVQMYDIVTPPDPES